MAVGGCLSRVYEIRGGLRVSETGRELLCMIKACVLWSRGRRNDLLMTKLVVLPAAVGVFV